MEHNNYEIHLYFSIQLVIFRSLPLRVIFISRSQAKTCTILGGAEAMIDRCKVCFKCWLSQIQLAFISISPPSFSLMVSEVSGGRSPRSGKGSKEVRLHRIIKKAKLSKLSFVIPKSWVRPAPISPPRTLPPFEMDMRVAKSVASIPSGHNLAASTRTGMKEACKY